MTDIDTSPEAVERFLEGTASDTHLAILLRQLAKEKVEARNAALDEVLSALKDFQEMSEMMGDTSGARTINSVIDAILALITPKPDEPTTT